MSYLGLNMNGGIHHCYPFYENMISCAKTQLIPGKMCIREAEDYLECYQKKKQVRFLFKSNIYKI